MENADVKNIKFRFKLLCFQKFDGHLWQAKGSRNQQSQGDREEVEHLVYEEYDTKEDEVMAIIVTAVATWASCVNILSQVEAVVRNICIKHKTFGGGTN